MAVGDQHGVGQKQMQVPRKGSWRDNDMQLDKAVNAWKPSAVKSVLGRRVSDPEHVKTQEVFRLFRSILNKLSPEKFPQLMKRVEELEIDSEERLRGVIDLTFEKAIAEPGFSASYAKMCHHLLALKVRTPDGQEVNFRRLLLDLCQREFERNKQDAEALKKNQEAQAAASEEEKKKLEELEEAELKARTRSLGNIRFIGELFKLKMLTGAIMHDCIKMLLNNKDEESLECLCRLVSTMGKDLDVDKAKPRMDKYIGRMEQIVKERKSSSRICFMLQDVIDLRLNKWVPRREQQGPKTIGQIHLEAEQEELRELEMVHMRPKEDDREPMEVQRAVEERLNEPINFSRFNIGTKTLHVDFGNQSFRPRWQGVNRPKGSNGFNSAKPAVPGGSLRQPSKARDSGEHMRQNSDRRSVPQDKRQNNQDNKQRNNQQCGQNEDEGSSAEKSKEQSGEILVNKMQECQVNETKETSVKELSSAELSKRLDALMKDNSDHQTISDWIQRNLDEQQTSSNLFITALVTCICKSTIISGKFYKMDYVKISQQAALLQRYLQDKEHKQLQALHALQVLMVQMDHPPQLLRMIFDCLCDMGVIKEEVFFMWESSRDAVGQEGKDLAVKSVSGFFKWLKSCQC